MRNAFSQNVFVFDRNFFEILKVFCSQTPEDLVLEWFRHRNGPDGQVKSASIDPKSSTKAHLRSRQRFWSSGAFKMTPGSEIWVCLPVLGSPQVGLSARFRSGGSVFDRNFAKRKTPRGVCFRIAFREILSKGKR